MNILIITKNWLGDLFFQLPAIEAVAERWPEASITCMSPSRCLPILKMVPQVSGFIAYDEKNEQRPFWKRFAVISQLRKKKWDKVYIFHRSKTRAFIAWAAGCKDITGFDIKGRSFLTCPVKAPAEACHHVDYFLYLLGQSGFHVTPNAVYRCSIPSEDKAAAAEIILGAGLNRQPFVCFHLGANWEPKRWPTRHFAELGRMIYSKYGWSIVVTGAAGDQPLADEFLKHAADYPVTVLTGKTSLPVLGGIFEKAAFLVSGDSGPMHIASAIGCRTAAIFGPTNPALTGPRGQGENLVISYVPPGYEAPFTGDDFPTVGWIEKIEPQRVFEMIENRSWFSERLHDVE